MAGAVIAVPWPVRAMAGACMRCVDVCSDSQIRIEQLLDHRSDDAIGIIVRL